MDLNVCVTKDIKVTDRIAKVRMYTERDNVFWSFAVKISWFGLGPFVVVLNYTSGENRI